MQYQTSSKRFGYNRVMTITVESDYKCFLCDLNYTDISWILRLDFFDELILCIDLKMKFFVAVVINLVLLVQISQSHSIRPTIIEKVEGDDMQLLNQDESSIFPEVPEVTEPVTSFAEEPKERCKEPELNTNKSADADNKDTLVFAQVIYRHGERDIPKKIELTNVMLQ